MAQVQLDRAAISDRGSGGNTDSSGSTTSDSSYNSSRSKQVVEEAATAAAKAPHSSNNCSCRSSNCHVIISLAGVIFNDDRSL